MFVERSMCFSRIGVAAVLDFTDRVSLDRNTSIYGRSCATFRMKQLKDDDLEEIRTQLEMILVPRRLSYPAVLKIDRDGQRL